MGDIDEQGGAVLAAESCRASRSGVSESIENRPSVTTRCRFPCRGANLALPVSPRRIRR